jgi:hypothetical protein
MKYTVEMGSGTTICTETFVKIESGNRKLIGWGLHRHTDRKEIA